MKSMFKPLCQSDGIQFGHVLWWKKKMLPMSKSDSGAYLDMWPTCKIAIMFMDRNAHLKGALVKTHSLCRAAQRIWWILWEAPAPPAAPGTQRRREMPPRCCTSPPLCSGPHGTAEHPPCASDLTTRQQRDNINITNTAETLQPVALCF